MKGIELVINNEVFQIGNIINKRLLLANYMENYIFC